MVSPSVYDTAQVLRLIPSDGEAQAQGMQWLLAQQHADGGWGAVHQPSARTLPTVAALLALHTQPSPATAAAINRGHAFLAAHGALWHGEPLPDDIPVGVELVLPPLVEAACRLELAPPLPMDGLVKLGERRRRRITAAHIAAGSTPSHSWEAFAAEATPTVIDGSGGVGHSPAATAAWLARAVGRPELAGHSTTAKAYLAAAEAATEQVGTWPTVWPITHFEELWVLHAFGCAGLLRHPALAPAVEPLLCRLRNSLTARGIGMSPFFMCDGDITATALVTLRQAELPVDLAMLAAFATGDHFATYPGELQPSLSTTAHALQAYAGAGRCALPALRFLAEHQQPDGRWQRDKWHSSWLYTTGVVIHALLVTDAAALLRRGLDALCAAQTAEGGWGMGDVPTPAETAYALLACTAALAAGVQVAGLEHACDRAGAWLLRSADVAEQPRPHRWIGKELYTPYRVDAAYIVAALLAHQQRIGS